MHVGLRQEPQVARAQKVRAQGGAAPRQRRRVRRVPGQVAHRIRIRREVVQLLRRLLAPEGILYGIEAPGIVASLPHLRGRRLEHVREVLALRPIRVEVADVEIAAVANRARHVHAFVHAIAARCEPFARRAGIRPHERAPLHPRRRADTCDTQHRRCEVEEADEAIAGHARPVSSGASARKRSGT